MASYYGNAPTVNISTGVKAKLQKWIGKASTNVRDKRSASCKEMFSAEMKDYESQLQINNGMPVPQHSRTCSAPIPMLNAEKVVKKRRKGSVTNPPTNSAKNRENDRNDSYPKNGIPRGLSHSMVLYESSSDPSSSQRKQNDINRYSKELNLGDQPGSVGVNTTNRSRAQDDFKSMNSNAKAEVSSSRALTKGKRPARAVSKTSGENSDESAGSDNEKIASTVVFDSSPNGVQQISGQIQHRLQKWVERASYLAAMRDRRPSEESASSTDDSLNVPDSPHSRSSGSETRSWKNESQVKKIKELELALKELVENIGVRSGSCSSLKQDGTSSPGSSSGQRSRHDSQRDNDELNGNEKQSLLNKLSRDIGESGLHQSRNNSSSSESDACVNMADSVKLLIDNPEETNGLLSENQMDDVDDVIMKSSCPIPTRDPSKKDNPHTHSRRSITLQDVLLCETLIEQFPKQNGNDSVKKIPQTNSKKVRNDTVLKSNGVVQYSFEATGNKNRSGKTELTEGRNGTENSKLSENKPGAGKKLERPKLRKQATAPDGNCLLKVGGTELSVRESMRQYLNFKDADLSAFAVECVRHANKKKQILQEEDAEKGAEKENIGEKTLQPPKKGPNTNETEGTQSVRSTTTEQKPIVIISSKDEDGQPDEAKRSKTPPASLGSSLDDETANETTGNVTKSRYVFARTAEEAEWFAKEFLSPARGVHVAEKGCLGRTSSNPQRDPVTSQRLYKFPSMPMFYIPKENADSENAGKQKKNETLDTPSLSPQRRSVVSFPSALVSLNPKTDPFYHGLLTDPASNTKLRANSSIQLTVKDENDNEVNKKSTRPMMRKRKNSAPPRSGLYPMTNVRVDIEAII